MCECTLIVFIVLHDACCRSPEETIWQQGAESDHLDLGGAPDAHVPLPTDYPKARTEGHKSDNGERTNSKPSLDSSRFSYRGLSQSQETSQSVH